MVQLERQCWVGLDDGFNRWALERERRKAVACLETLEGARAFVAAELERAAGTSPTIPPSMGGVAHAEAGGAESWPGRRKST